MDSRPLITLTPISPGEAPVLQNLFELYCHDFSEYIPLDLKASGRFEIGVGSEWWSAGHFPYFIRCGGRLCGFALARRGSVVTGDPNVLDVAEFFVVRGVRRTGVGAGAARALFAELPGCWEVRVRASNVAANQFWTRVAGAAAGTAVTTQTFSAQGVDWSVLRFRPAD